MVAILYNIFRIPAGPLRVFPRPAINAYAPIDLMFTHIAPNTLWTTISQYEH